MNGRAVVVLVASLVTVGCGDGAEKIATGDGAAPHDVDKIGTCRSETARAEAQGHAVVEWVPLSVGIGGSGNGAVVEATAIEDLGERTVSDPEPGGVEASHDVRLTVTKQLSGDAPSDNPLLLTPYQLADAQAATSDGDLLVVRRDPMADRNADFGTVVAIRDDGDVLFLGDCLPRWKPAFASAAQRMSERPAQLIRELLVHPNGSAADAFRTTPEANARAGPWDPGREPPASGAEIGVAYRHTIRIHCGVVGTSFDGRVWLFDPPLGDDSGNPPAGWGDENDGPGTITLETDRTATFHSFYGPVGKLVAAPSGTPDPSQACE